MNKKIPTEVKKKYEEHKRVSLSPMSFNSWFDLYTKNKIHAIDVNKQAVKK